MIKRFIVAVVVLFVAWTILDFLIHGLWLVPTYELTAELWRPPEEMMMGLMAGVRLLVAVCFIAIFVRFVPKRAICVGMKYGLLIGLIQGASAGFGSYCYLPIPLHLAWAWFTAALIQFVVGGTLIGVILKNTEGKGICTK